MRNVTVRRCVCDTADCDRGANFPDGRERIASERTAVALRYHGFTVCPQTTGLNVCVRAFVRVQQWPTVRPDLTAREMNLASKDREHPGVEARRKITHVCFTMPRRRATRYYGFRGKRNLSSVFLLLHGMLHKHSETFLSIHPPICLFIYLFIYLLIYSFISLAIYFSLPYGLIGQRRREYV